MTEQTVQMEMEEQPRGFYIQWGLWLPMLASLGLHIYYAMRDRVVWGDEPFYLWLGQNWLDGKGYQFLGFNDVHHPPGYPLVTALLSYVTQNAEWASTLAYIIFGTLLIFPVYGIARRLYGERSAGWAAFTVALLPALTAVIPLWGTMTEPPFIFLVTLALYLAILAVQGSGAWAYGLVGLSLGLAYLVRPEAVLFFLVFSVLLFFVPLLLGGRSWGWFAGLILLVLGFAASFGSYAYYTYIVTDSWLVSEKVGVTFGHALYLSQNDSVGFDRNIWGLDSTGTQVFFFSEESYHLSMIDTIRDDPREFARIVYRNMRAFPGKLSSVQLLPVFLMPLAILGLFRKSWGRQRVKGEILLIFSLLPSLSFLLFFVLERYYAPLLIPLAIWAGEGLAAVGDWYVNTVGELRGRPLPSWRSGTVRLLLVLPVMAGLLLLQPRAVTQASDNRSFRSAHEVAGLWLESNTPLDARVMARYPAIAFHGERQWVPSPHASYEDSIRYAQAQQADYWVLDSWEREWRPQLGFLLDGQTPPELELLQRYDQGDAFLLIFRIRPSN